VTDVVGVRAVVRLWDDDEGWGVADADEVPGGCWVGFAQVAVEGYRRLTPGASVTLEFEEADQDGYAYRARRVWPWGSEPYEPPAQSDGAAYSSTLRLDFD
jgi:CspA family cold shock protein